MKKSLILAAAGFFMLAGQAPAATKSVADVYKAAEKEGQVMWATTLTEAEAMPITEAFNKSHPKIKATYQRQHGGEAMERLMREVISGEVPHDVVLIHPDYMTEFLKLDVIAKVDWSAFGVPPNLIPPGGLFVSPFDSPFVIVYNKSLIKPEEAPKNWEDFLDPKWKGRFIVDSRPSGFLRLTGAWGPEKTLAYLRKLAVNKPVFVRGQGKAAALMAAGDYQLAISMYLWAYVSVGEQKGGPLGFNIPNPLPTAWYNMCVLKKGIQNPNAARVFLGWLGSEGCKIQEKVNWGRAAPFKGSHKEKLYKGITLAYPPTVEQVPDRSKYTLEMLKALGARK